MKCKRISTPSEWRTLKPHPFSELTEFGVGIDIEALAAHTQKFIMNSHLDPELRDDKDTTLRRDFGLTPEEMLALMHFLKALDGGPIDPVLLPAKK